MMSYASLDNQRVTNHETLKENPMKTNPYIAGNPVGGGKAFIGRTDVLRDVLRVLTNPKDQLRNNCPKMASVGLTNPTEAENGTFFHTFSLHSMFTFF